MNQGLDAINNRQNNTLNEEGSGKIDFKQVEKFWQDAWFKNNLYQATDFDAKPKKYILTEFPYPSGASLHIGHAFRYTVPDVYARFLRMNGYNVLFPIGWDAFGLPTEERARKEGKNPKVITKENIANFKAQVLRMGYGFDWNREFATTDEDYYKWTQWIFGEFYKAGLAEQKEIDLWWCPEMGTVLSNEEVLDGPDGSKISERGEHPVFRKKMKQWILKMPEYAEKLLDGLEGTHFPQHVKDMQKNWIGKSKGCTVRWEVQDVPETIQTFTTRIDTIFAATFLVLAPEHPLALQLATEENLQQVEDYITEVKNKSERERQIGAEKTGVFTGSFAINPITNEQVPIWIADYVLGGYGTGAIMAVPGHDERDFEFAKKFDLEVLENVKSATGEKTNEIFTDYGILFNSGEYSGLTSEEAKGKLVQKLELEGKGKKEINYKFRDWVFSRQRYWGEPFPFEYVKANAYLENLKTTEIDGEFYEIKLLDTAELPLILPDVEDYLPSPDGHSPLAKTDWINIKDGQGRVVGKREPDTMPNWAGSSWYYLRYCDPKNDTEFANYDKLKYWLPVDHYFGGSEHTTLHLLYSRFWHKFLFDKNYVPTPEPYDYRTNGGLLLGPDGRKMSKSLGNVISPDDKLEVVGADALRIYINFIGPYDGTVIWQDGGLKACKRLIDNIWNLKTKVETKNSSVEAITASPQADGVFSGTNELGYTIRKAKIEDAEAITELTKQGCIVAYPNADLGIDANYVESLGFPVEKTMEEIRESQKGKMQIWVVEKSDRVVGVIYFTSEENSIYLNTIDVLPQFIGQGIGSMLIQKMLDFAENKPVHTEVISYNDRAQKFYQKHGFAKVGERRRWIGDKQVKQDVLVRSANSKNKKLLVAYHKMVKKITEQIPTLRTNVAVAELMTFVNVLKAEDSIDLEVWKGFLQVLAPLAPHISEELWYEANRFDKQDYTKSIHLSSWPVFDPELCTEDEVKIVVQINGKVRAEFQAAKDADENELIEQAKTIAQKWLEGKQIKFSKVVPNKMVAFAVG